MQFKGFLQVLFILLIIHLSYGLWLFFFSFWWSQKIQKAQIDLHSKVCLTQEGVAWCEDSLCYYKAGGNFIGNYCRAATSDGILKFNGSNCRRCPSTSCEIVTPSYTGSLNIYHNYNGYFLTVNGWCYYGN